MLSRALGAGALLSATFPATLGTVNYDHKEAQNFASIASVTYCDDKSQLESWSCVGCKDSNTRLVPGKVKIFDGSFLNGSRVLVGKLRDEHGCVVAFRGSDNWMNFVEDLEYWGHHVRPGEFDGCEGCKVHSGFYSIWKDVQKDVDHALDEVGCEAGTPDGENIFVSGHSQGGAVAQLAAFSFMKAGLRVTKIYTFEAPRFGNKVFVGAFSKLFANAAAFRITHQQDPVVHLPPQLVGYEHAPTEVYYDGRGKYPDGKYKVCKSVEDSSCADQFKNAITLAAHKAQHCATPLLPNGNFCWPQRCLNPAHVHAMEAAAAKTGLVIV